MKPLRLDELPAFNKRFSSFKDAEFRSLNIISPLQIQATFAVQDSARAYDWITITLEFNGVNDAKFLENSHLHLIDMSDGANLLKDENLFAFGIGECYNISTIKSASCYIVANTLKYEEGLF
ncbi:hypothetical protein JHD47_00845 [Sulfurimonas sp. SAG-AH-194-L11]|nr:hypothetical protein [Sulfurimonas sp. SAG-AH-194-L11]MDF1876362.1 hypothetical protein [Sulfurimonas sp. SAG-AH-194-L11]